jgi:hypothetical protein
MTAIAVAAMMTFSQFRLFSISEEKSKIFSNYTYYVHEQKNSEGEQKIDREAPGLDLSLLGRIGCLPL